MTRAIVVVREVGKLNPEYSLEFDLPEVPRVGSYISINRPDNPEPYGEDMIVEKVWWRLHHPETRAGFSASEPAKIGKLTEIFVECIQATGPWSSDRWRDMLDVRRERGAEIPQFDLARVQVRQDAFKGK
ncbi:hypothetical protein [Bradyrhizobium sp. Arg816]|uniref:hypothetical protein n=1 Tax=Bradyrhizobium sp. Arg816 TaxID=2998491 RepID=UPI00249DA784|nr:hypothetical protein [Bradyrhizobium sp. Arg816]MDI3567111.1 hypothetical protein [Bradyrhizobium sp. Arg816]